MDSPIFQKHYKRLNAEQKMAVDAIDGPVMVVAGPGTGKTQILTLRIANILRETDTRPENILALTFTESGVVSMRRRLSEIIGSPSYSVVISTFHGFCNDIIKNYPEDFPRIIGSQNITEVDQINIIEDAITKLPLKEIKPFGDTFHYIKDILKSINDLKKEGIDPDEFSKLMKKELKDFNAITDLYHEKGAHKGKMKGDYQGLLRDIRKNEELAEVYEYYEKQLTKAKLYDYNDMIMEVLRELSANKDLLLILQEQHQYILVDEHQDTNNSQNKIMELLCNFHPNPNIFVVGDEKQAIFRFQGASLENFIYFKKLYPKAKLIILEENYRSTQAILDSAHSVLQGEKKLKSNARHENIKIRLYEFPFSETELYFLAKDIKTKIESGAAPQEIAVLYRDNKDVFPLAKMFEKIGIPFSIESDQDLMDDHDIKKIILLLQTINEFGQPEKLFEALHIDFLNIHPLDIYKLAAYSAKNKISPYDIIRSKKTMSGLDLDSETDINGFYMKLAGWATMSKNQSLPDFFEFLIRESGFLAYLMKQPDAIEKMNKLNGLFDEIKTLIEKHKNFKLKDFLDYINTLESHNLLIKKSLGQKSAKQVRFMTAHKSKGQEFEYVYIINAYNGHWGNKRRTNLLSLPNSVFSLSDGLSAKDEKNNDERRLFYVALTRAKKAVAITYSKEGSTKKEQLPCQFIREIKPEFLDVMPTEKYEKEFESEKEITFSPPKTKGTDMKDKEFIKELFMQRGFSVTALNNYLRCPWSYFYTNLLRIPKASTKHELYGTAVHNALKDFFGIFKERTPDKQFLIDKFAFYLNREPLQEKDFKESLEKGKKALGGYYETYKNMFITPIATEFNIAGIMLTPEVRLTGKIDKIELIGAGNEVNVVDYKTSKPKTRGEMEGSTENSNGDIKRQIIFYNLLLNKYENGKKFKMVSGDIDFIEPDGKGRYKKERFSINPEEIDELEKLILKTTNEILSLSFWDKSCEDEKCEFCALRKMMA
jgi:DNA helicase-2/ATP-dependent DNA helicase PcrA